MAEYKTSKKPQIEGDMCAWGSWWYICPVCHDQLDYKQSKCKHCGQKIDWSKDCEQE